MPCLNFVSWSTRYHRDTPAIAGAPSSKLPLPSSPWHGAQVSKSCSPRAIPGSGDPLHAAAIHAAESAARESRYVCRANEASASENVASHRDRDVVSPGESDGGAPTRVPIRPPHLYTRNVPSSTSFVMVSAAISGEIRTGQPFSRGSCLAATGFRACQAPSGEPGPAGPMLTLPGRCPSGGWQRDKKLSHRIDNPGRAAVR